MKIEFENSRDLTGRFHTGVSLHSHTHHSRESLVFIYRHAAEVTILRSLVERGERRYSARHNGAKMDLNRAWWAPPLAPRDAWKLEKSQIEDRLGLASLVSLTDHDDIEAGMSLRVLSECRHTPVSVEWTVPFRNTFFHIGLHNLPAEQAREMMRTFAAVTDAPSHRAIVAVFEWIHEWLDTLVVFNHPCWDENRIGAAEHRAAAEDFIRRYGRYLHALEINGLRPWSENQNVIRFAHEIRLPVISGGDRHALEPNVILNLTNAATFPEFVAEVRAGHSHVLVTDQYNEPFKLRILHSIAEILDSRWTDRVFYICEDGVTRSLTELFAERRPAAIRVFTHGVHLLRRGVTWLRPSPVRPIVSRQSA